MSSNPNSPRKNSESKGGSSGPGFLLYLIFATIGIVLLAMFMIKRIHPKLPYPRFEQLVLATPKLEEGQPKGESYGMIVVDEIRDGQRHRIRYSHLRKVVVGTTQIRSVVDVEDLDAPTAAARQPKEVKFVTNLAPSHGVVQDVKKLLQNSAVDWDFHEGESAWQAYLPMLVFSGVILLVFVFLLRRLGGAGSPMQFGRSRGKLYAMEDLAITFDDVAGIDEAVAEVREIVDFLKSPEKYQRLGGRIPRGVLLVGPPGTGKTLLAKAIAGEAGVPFFGLSGSDFVEMFVGVGAARVRDMFQQAEQKAPCIIFIDELDALGKSRGNSIMGSHDEREQTLNALLVEMDGFDSNRGVIVMAATNRPEILDGALLRPGRFDRQVLVDRPDIMGRAAILKVHVKHVKLDESVDIDQIAAITPGFAGADLANLVNEAALLAARREKPAVTMEEFNESVERAMAGLEKKQRVMNDDEKLRVAYHEAGHALVAYSLPNTDPVHKVSIIPRGMAALGYTLQRPEGDRFLMTQAELESNIQVLMGGTIAEEIVFQDVSTGAKNDLERATKIARSMVTEYGMSRLGRINLSGSTSSAFLPSLTEEATAYHSEQTAREVDEEVKRILDRSLSAARDIIQSRRPALEALAQSLMEKEAIDASELKRIIEENSPRPLVVPGTGTPSTGTSSSSSAAREETSDQTPSPRSGDGEIEGTA